MHTHLPAIVVLAAVIVELGGCNPTKQPNPGEKNPPNVVFRTTVPTYDPKTQQWIDVVKNITSLSLGDPASTTGTKLIVCAAHDAGGVKSMTLTFSEAVSSCGNSGGALASGSFDYTPVLDDQNLESKKNSKGKVPVDMTASWVMYGKKKEGWFCSPATISPGPDRPYGASIYASCIATNYAGRSTQKILPMKFTNAFGQ